MRSHPTSPRSSHPASIRRLRLERLDERLLLAGDLEFAGTGTEDFCVPAEAPVARTAETSAGSEELYGPLLPVSTPAGNVDLALPEGEDPPPLGEPEIVDFTATQDGEVWLFQGTVLDDQPVEGLTVAFDGLLFGKFATVASDGSFYITETFPPETTGSVLAQTQDLDLLDSNIAEAVVFN